MFSKKTNWLKLDNVYDTYPSKPTKKYILIFLRSGDILITVLRHGIYDMMFQRKRKFFPISKENRSLHFNF